SRSTMRREPILAPGICVWVTNCSQSVLPPPLARLNNVFLPCSLNNSSAYCFAPLSYWMFTSRMRFMLGIEDLLLLNQREQFVFALLVRVVFAHHVVELVGWMQLRIDRDLRQALFFEERPHF